MLKCVIVEDEFPAREELKYFLQLYDEIELVNEFESSIDALKFLEDNKVDVAFLDINMAGIDGVNLGKILRKLDKNLKIIFITAYREYGVEAFEIEAFDYLLKPYSEERIRKTLDLLINSLKSQTSEQKEESNKVNKLAVMEDEKIIIIPFESINYIEASEKESLVHTDTKIYSSKLKISKLEEVLPSDKFFRTHRAYIVNLDKIVEVESWFSGSYLIKLNKVADKIPLSRSNIKDFKDLFIMK